VESINGVLQELLSYQDTIKLPNMTADGVMGNVTILLPFTRIELIGTFFYHCHMVEHEDGGMMARIEVVLPASAAATPKPFAQTAGGLAAIIVCSLAGTIAIIGLGYQLYKRRKQAGYQRYGEGEDLMGESSSPRTYT